MHLTAFSPKPIKKSSVCWSFLTHFYMYRYFPFTVTAVFMANNATQWLMEELANTSYTHLSPTANMGSRSSFMSCWMQGPIARASMLMQVKTVASTCMDFCLLKADTI